LQSLRGRGDGSVGRRKKQTGHVHARKGTGWKEEERGRTKQWACCGVGRLFTHNKVISTDSLRSTKIRRSEERRGRKGRETEGEEGDREGGARTAEG